MMPDYERGKRDAAVEIVVKRYTESYIAGLKKVAAIAEAVESTDSCDECFCGESTKGKIVKSIRDFIDNPNQ